MYKLIKFIFPILIISYSCEQQDDYSKFSKSYQYRAEFALPIGQSALTLENAGINLPQGWEQFPGLLKNHIILLQDTLSFNLKSIAKKNEYIESITFKIIVNNGFPTKSDLVFCINDSNSAYIDTLFATKDILAATYNGDSLYDSKYETSIFVDSTRLATWENAHSIIISGKIQNDTITDEQYLQFPKHKLVVEMGARIKFNFNYQDLKK